MDVLLESNTKTVEEFYRMRKNRETLAEVLERLGLTKEWEARGKAEGMVIGEARAAAESERLRRENERLRRENERLKARA
jgi:cell division protein FtsB